MVKGTGPRAKASHGKRGLDLGLRPVMVKGTGPRAKASHGKGDWT